MQSVLIVDDEPALVEVVAQYLQNDCFQVFTALDGPTAVEAFMECAPDLVLLDIGLPGFPGIEVMRRIRAIRNVPVIMLTARVGEIDLVVGLELGADDYIGKPFSPRELVARVRSVLRRTGRPEPATVLSRETRVGAICIDPVAHEVHVNGELVMLTPMQFKLLDVLAAHVGQTLTREQLITHVRSDGDVFDRTLDRHIANLRARIERDPADPQHIVTVFGIGYKMIDPT